MPILADDVVDLTMQLCAIDSVSGNEGEIVNLVARGLEENGWNVHRQQVYNDGKGRDNIYATRVPLGDHVPRLVFNSHFDTVPPLIPLRRTEEALFGRGVNEAKGQLACLIIAANRLIIDRPDIAKDVALLFVVGEEIDHAGMIAANDLPSYGPEFLIVGEPTEMKYAAIQKGALKVKLSVTGKAGHSGYPHGGESAIHKLIAILDDIMKYEWPRDPHHGDTTFNIGTISGGQALNAWAAKAEAGIFFRVTTTYEDLKHRIEEIVGGRAELDWSLGGNNPVKLTLPPYESPVGQASFNTDLPYFRGVEKLKGAFLYGAGTITKAFGPDEFVPIEELRECVDNHVKLAKTLLEQ
ncbi:hypothetical protein PFISCL1PPCAC_6826 [Pristionchus fissidentatus]|uniref:Peptidase M20 dimerisation domain-containing protein n=1 Tax=Pristionchus fissidentatus TaxID=1538716 RepID=A0AAV5V7T2_9BILA|nr:hypothetical protein PFISCL1PPCAC_6826 [Pristionchus fissidentatus]